MDIKDSQTVLKRIYDQINHNDNDLNYLKIYIKRL